MEKKQKIEIGLAVLIILALICVLVWIIYPREIQEDVIVDENGNIVVENDTDYTPTVDYSIYPESAVTIARVFAERFGSFSNQAGYINVMSVMDISTESLQMRLDKIINDAMDDDSGTYYGVSTIVLSSEQVSATDAQEVFRVLTQRKESIESPENTTIRYQTMVITLVKDGDNWLVDDFVWQ
jgi:hypothetical protein